jgi:hypothetical protein
MAKFMYIFRGGYAKPGELSPTQLQAHLAKWNAWAQSLPLAGAHQLEYPPQGKTLRGRDRVVTDGPYAESKDLVGGAVVVEAASLQEAADLARGCPIFDFDGSVEVRTLAAPPPK